MGLPIPTSGNRVSKARHPVASGLQQQSTGKPMKMRDVKKYQIDAALQHANDNYDTWGQWGVECYSRDELRAELEEFANQGEWIKIRKEIASQYKEIENTSW